MPIIGISRFYECGNDGQVHAFEVKMYVPVDFNLLVWCGAEVNVSDFMLFLFETEPLPLICT
jgi:hypothetical protein